eukprot:gene24503-32958_t
MSIPTFRNSLVFHDSDKLVILSLHFSPNVAIWGLRWFPKQVEESFPGIFTDSLDCGHDPQPQLNLFFTDSLCPEALRRGGYITMFDDMRARPGSDM